MGIVPWPTAFTMYILYLDESGTHGEASYFVLAGLAVFEREIHWFSQDLDELQSNYFPDHPEPIHFRAAQLRVRTGEKTKEPWDQLTAEQRRELKNKIYGVIRNRRGVLFACAVEKRFAQIRREDPYARAFEDLVSRFDLFMSRLNRAATSEGKEEQRGFIVLAESSYEKTLSLLARHIRERGTRWGLLHNVADIPLFASAQSTRLLQYADFCANAVYGRYHSKMTGDFDRIAPKLDQDGGVVHGLSHLTTDSDCACIACLTRRGRQQTLPTI